MKNVELYISPTALLVFALLWFFDGSGLYAAAVPAAAVHELGHAMFLWLGGLRLRSLKLGLFGLEMDYWGRLDGLTGAMVIGAGPAFGLLYAALCLGAEGEYWRLSGGVSLLLSVFNLLPVLPLDGGRLLALAAGERAEGISRVISLAIAALGLWLWLDRGWFSLFAMGAWLGWWNCRGLGRARRPRRTK